MVMPQASAATGIPAGLPLVAAAADKACEVIGAGALEPHVGCLSYGTTATINTTHKRYIEVIPLIPPYPAAVPGAYSLEIQIYRGYWMVSWFKKEFAHRERRIAEERGIPPEALFDELVNQGHTPVALVRPGSERKLRQADACVQVSGAIDEADAIRRTLEGADAAIYNIGILRALPRRGITFDALHFEGAKRSIDLAAETGVRRFLLMSANGVRADGTAYQRSKYMAEQYLATTGLEWTVFRPSVLFGDPRGRMEFATRLLRDIVRSPLPAPLFFDGLLPLDAGGFRLSPVHVKDVAALE